MPAQRSHMGKICTEKPSILISGYQKVSRNHHSCPWRANVLLLESVWAHANTFCFIKCQPPVGLSWSKHQIVSTDNFALIGIQLIHSHRNLLDGSQSHQTRRTAAARAPETENANRMKECAKSIEKIVQKVYQDFNRLKASQETLRATPSSCDYGSNRHEKRRFCNRVTCRPFHHMKNVATRVNR